MMMTRSIVAIFASLAVLCSTARAQLLPVDGTQPATAGQLSTIQSSIPTPSTAIPPGATPAGAGGSGLVYQPANAIPITRWRSARVTTTSTGTFTATWAVPFVSSAPVPEQPAAINTNSSTMPIVCNYTSFTATGATGFCAQSSSVTLGSTLLAIAGTVVNTFSNPAANMIVGVTGHEPSQ